MKRISLWSRSTPPERSTLVTIQADDENDDDHESINEEHGRTEVDGQIAAIGGGSVTVHDGGGDA